MQNFYIISIYIIISSVLLYRNIFIDISKRINEDC